MQQMRQMSAGQFPTNGFRGPTASSEQRTTQQAFENWFTNTPGLKVVRSFYSIRCKRIIKAAIRDNDPVILWKVSKCIW
jgi:pyruvate dehydrogenase E1 component beta subunit